MDKSNITVCFYKRDNENIPVWIGNDPNRDLLISSTTLEIMNKKYPDAYGNFYVLYQGKEFKVVDQSLS